MKSLKESLINKELIKRFNKENRKLKENVKKLCDLKNIDRCVFGRFYDNLLIETEFVWIPDYVLYRSINFNKWKFSSSILNSKKERDRIASEVIDNDDGLLIITEAEINNKKTFEFYNDNTLRLNTLTNTIIDFDLIIDIKDLQNKIDNI